MRPSENRPSRRAALAALAGAGAVVAGGLRPSIGAAAPPPDPVFAAIEAHRVARAAYEAAKKKATAIGEQNPHAAWGRPRVQMATLRHRGGEAIPKLAYSHDDIRQWARSFSYSKKPEERRRTKIWIAEKIRKFDMEERRWWEWRETSGFETADMEQQVADDDEHDAYLKLVRCTATTLPGAVAYAQYVVAHERKHCDFDDTDPRFDFVTTLERTLAGLAPVS